MSMRRYLGRVESDALLNRDVVIRLDENFKFDVGTRVAIFEIADEESIGLRRSKDSGMIIDRFNRVVSDRELHELFNDGKLTQINGKIVLWEEFKVEHPDV